MNLQVRHEVFGVGQVLAVEDSPFWDSVPLSEVDLGKLLYVEKLGLNASKSCAKEALQHLLLCLQFPDAARYIPLGDVLKRRNGIVGANFPEVLVRLRDLGRLPRFRFSRAVSEERPVDDEFLRSVVSAAVLDLETDHDLIQELKADRRCCLFFSWEQLSEEVGEATVEVLAQKFQLYQTVPARPPWPAWHPEEPEMWPVERLVNLQGKVLVLQYKEGLLDEEEDVYNASGIHPQMAHEQFVRENPDLLCHSRDARNFYFEVEPTERAQWLAYGEGSVFTESLPDFEVSQVNLDSKACRDLRHRLIVSVFHDLYEWCKNRQRWEFSRHFWYEDGTVSVSRYKLAVDLKRLRGEPVRKSLECNVYGRFGKVPRTTELNLHGPGLVYQVLDATELTTPGQAITDLYRRIFGVRKAWNERRDHYLSQAARLKNSSDPAVRRRAASFKAMANLMGAFLTQEQLEDVRKLTVWLYDRFQTPPAERVPTQKFPASPSRMNNLEEALRRIKAQIELLERELLIHHATRKARSFRRSLRKLLAQAKGLNRQQVELARLSPEFAGLLPRYLQEGEALELQTLEVMADALEDDVRRLLDPAHPEFDVGLSTAKLIYGRNGLHRRLEDLRQRLQQAPQPMEALAHMLAELEEKYDFCESRNTAFLEDLSPRQRRALGIETEGDDW